MIRPARSSVGHFCTLFGLVVPLVFVHAAGLDDLSHDRAIKAAARAAAQEALDDLLKADDFRFIELLPRRWEKRLDDYMARQLVVLCLRRLGDTGKLTLRDPATVVTPSQVEAAGGLQIKFGQTTVTQDITTINGRCAWAVERLLTTSRNGDYFLHFEPLDQKPFRDLDALLADQRISREERESITSRWQRVVITEQLNKDSEKLEDAIDITERAIVQKMRVPARLRKWPDDPRSDPDVLARAALEELMTQATYREMRTLPSKWGSIYAETTLKHLALRLLGRLDDPERVDFPIDAISDVIIMNQYINQGEYARFSRTDEMLEQDIYVTNGRCAWALERLMGITLPSFDAELSKDRKKLRAAIREAHCRVIEAMELPEKPWVKKFREE